MVERLPNLILSDAGPLRPTGRIGSERLLAGMWPRSVAMWMTGFWMVLFILQPWDQLFPELGEWHFERFYALAVIILVLDCGLFRLTDSWQTFGVLTFLFAVMLSWLFAVSPAEGWDDFYVYATMVVFYFILISVVRTPYDLVFICLCYVGGMAVYLLKSEYEFFVHGHYVHTMGVKRLIGIETLYGGSNALAASTVLTMPVAWFLWQTRREFTKTWPVVFRQLLPFCLVVYACLAASAVVLTNSRSGMLGFVLFVLAVGHFSGKLSTKLYGAVGGILLIGVIWLIIPEENRGRVRTIWAPETGPASAWASAYGRVEGLLASLVMFERFPVTGVGVGNFIPYRVANVDGIELQPHNLYGQVLAETGLVGTVAFLLLIGPTLANCRKTRRLARAKPDPVLRLLSPLAGACLISLLLLLFFGLFGHNLLRFHWLWIAAFGLLCRMFAEAAARGNGSISAACLPLTRIAGADKPPPAPKRSLAAQASIGKSPSEPAAGGSPKGPASPRKARSE